MDIVIKISQDRKFIKIGKSVTDSTWYLYDASKATEGSNVKKFTHELVGNQKVIKSIEFEAKSEPAPSVNTNIEPVVQASTEAPKIDAPSVTHNPTKNDRSVGNLSDLYNNKDSAMLSTAITMFAMQGMIDPSNVTSIIDTVYKKYKSL